MKLLSGIERVLRVFYILCVDVNGIYCVNSKGQFNDLYGRYKRSKIINEDVLCEASDYFKRNIVLVGE